VFATDLDEAALAIGREGRYPHTIEADLPEDSLRRFFTREGDHYRITRELRDVVLFARHSLLKGPPFSRIDLISCRNVLIYLDRELQQQICTTFHFALRPAAYLFLGSSENADSPNALFRSIDRDSRIYQCKQTAADPIVASRIGPPSLGLELLPPGASPRFRSANEAGVQTLYRVLQEGLTNIVKHAGARKVGVALEVVRDDVVMVVEDDGKGNMTDEPDGSLTVRFRAGGLVQIANHLMTWGPTVTILGPERLRETMRKKVERLYGHFRGGVGQGLVRPNARGASARGRLRR
jgi:hypothetical protein